MFKAHSVFNHISNHFYQYNLVGNVLCTPATASEAKGNDLVDEEAYLSERIAALNQPLARSGSDTNADDEVELDSFPTVYYNLIR